VRNASENSMTGSMIHEHRWIFAGDLALTVPRGEKNVDLRRLEYCIECGAIRVKFDTGWASWYSGATKDFLEPFEGNKDTVVEPAPEEYKILRPKSPKSKNRLGRGLVAVIKESTSNETLEVLIGGKK